MTPTLSHVSDDEFSNPLVKGEGLDGKNNQGAGQQGRPVREIMYGGYRHSPGPSSPKVERAAMKKVRKIRELQGQQSVTSMSITPTDAQKSPNNRMASG